MLSSHSQKFRTIIFSISVFIFVALPAFAQDCVGIEGCYGLNDAAKDAGFKTANSSPTPAIILGRIIQYLLSFIGILFMLIIIYAGAYWMFSQGEESKVEKAHKMITSASIGLLIVMAAYVITRLVTDQLVKIVETAV